MVVPPEYHQDQELHPHVHESKLSAEQKLFNDHIQKIAHRVGRMIHLHYPQYTQNPEI